MTDSFSIIVGFGHYSEFMSLNKLLADSSVTIGGMASDLQGVFDAVTEQRKSAKQSGLVVILSPEVKGYAPDFIQQLLFDEDGPIPVVGYCVNDTANSGAIMKKNGAAAFFELSKMHSATQLITLLSSAYEQALADREAGNHRLIPDIPSAPAGAIRSQCIVVYLPKGGGSSRTTTAVNLAACFARLGDPTCIVDFDPTKGDVAWMLGYAPDHTNPLTKRSPVVDRGVFDLVMNVLSNWRPGGSVDPTLLRRHYLVEWRGRTEVGKNLHFLPGLLSPVAGGHAEWREHEGDIYDIGKAIIRALKTMYLFVIVDVGQDYNQALVGAALDEATEIIIPVPPNRHAIMDIQRALPPMLEAYGTKDRLRWFPALWSDNVGAPEVGTISDMLGIPRLNVKIPHDHQVADQSINDCVPFVLWDEGPLGTNMKLLAANYDPRAKELARGGKQSEGMFKKAQSLLFRGA